MLFMSAATLCADVCLRSFELLEHIQARQCVYGGLFYLVEDIKAPLYVNIWSTWRANLPDIILPALHRKRG